MLHTALVLFLALAILQAGKTKLNPMERKQLSTYLVFHDIGRTKDVVNDRHGKAGCKIYEASIGKSLDPVSDLKDADALNRVQFSIDHPDVNQLRLPSAHKLAPLAITAVTGIKI